MQDDRLAIDGDAGTYSLLKYGAGGGEILFRAQAPEGVTFSSGSNAGAVLDFPEGSFSIVGVRFNFYAAGVPVALAQGGAMAVNGGVSGAGAPHYFSAVAPMAFDSVEAVVTLYGNVDPTSIAVFEFCGDGV